MRTLLWLLLPLALAAVQARLPTLGWAGGLRLELLPCLVAYGALAWRRPGTALLYAALAGLAQDALSAAPFGLSLLGYGTGVLVVIWLRRWLDRDLPWVQMLAGAAVAGVNAALAALAVGLTAGGAARACCLLLLGGALTPFVVLGARALRAGLEVEAR